MGFLRYKWTWLILGGFLIAFGAYSYTSAHPAVPVEIDGTIANYEEFTRNNKYDHNELALVGDPKVYMFDRTSFHPSMPDTVFKDGKVSIWVDQGSTSVLAITLYDENDQNPIKYTSPDYDNPAGERSNGQSFGIVAGVMGAILVGVFGLMFFLGRGRPRPAMQSSSGAPPPVA